MKFDERDQIVFKVPKYWGRVMSAIALQWQF
jgi:hypothetical protein